ncbi:plant thionin family protein [Striga asiatica]|uniref:Plant thionin family protein n=1 Tax=Striga asiatica TaxID=4170 RepID=A0A5A7QSN4_STRAF|nr:plant thionin family protein [Striga asiatica]
MDHQGKVVRAIAAIAVMVLMCAGHVSASCYGSCLEDCYADGGERIKCLIQCLIKCKMSTNISSTALKYCAAFGDDVKKVEDCVNKWKSGPTEAKYPLPGQ